MFARVSRYQIPAARFGQVVPAFRDAMDQVQQLEGNKGGYLLIDRDNNTALTLTLWETQAALQASEVAANRMRSDSINTVEGDILTIDRCEVALDFTESARV
jgi:heme-degrading monooxygenase HmoA